MANKKAKMGAGVESFEKDGCKYVRVALDDDTSCETNLYGMFLLRRMYISFINE